VNALGNRFRVECGGLIDRSRPLRFRFGGRAYTGFAGDTLASALLANGVRLVGRSFKFHRPRGIMAAGVEEPNALVQLGRGDRSAPNLRATEIALFDGLEATPVNCWPSVGFDISSVNNLVSRFLAAGFYYKTFMWPHWHVYEGLIRRAAGLGKVGGMPDPDRYESRYAHCDVLVVGAGAAGLAAARAAAVGGARVILAEQDSRIGGQLLWDGGEIEGVPGHAWAGAVVADLGKPADVRVLTNTTVTGYFDHNALTMIEAVSGDDPAAPPNLPRYRLWQVRAGRVILATGAIERPLVFPGNDRPGVMLASAVREYIARYAVRPGKVAVVFTNNDTAYRTAVAFQEAGGMVAAVVDTRPEISDACRELLSSRGIPLFPAGRITATAGGKGLRRVSIRHAGTTRVVQCDLLAMSGGVNPTVHLFSQSGGALAFDDARAMMRPSRSIQAERSVGAANGGLTLSQALMEGHEAGVDAASGPIDLEPPRATAEHASPAIEAAWLFEGHGKAFVDFQNDVSASDIALSARENFVSVEHLKRYTTLGMASDQGKTSNINALAIMSQLTGRSIERTGTTRYRFPFVPTALGAFAGRARGELLRPIRRLALHERHIAAGAVMEDFGWLRPAAYPLPGESREDAERREVRMVRQQIGIFDGSPLGKIEVKGPDAARFLDFIYANAMSTLAVGKVRYGLMLNELGVIIDDGVCARLGDDHFLVGTSSAGAERIADWLEEWLQCELIDYDVLVAPVTTSWAVVTLTGPRARELLLALGADFPVGEESFGHMSFRQGTVAGIAARVFRVSYTGETSFEINVSTAQAALLWDKAMAIGAPWGVTPVGIDAWNLLRLEKGYLHIGADTDGTSTPLNVGWSRVLKRKGDFVGKRSLHLPVNQSGAQLELVGLQALDGTMLPIGAHAIAYDGKLRRSDGFVTSSGNSEVLGGGVAMAMLHRGSRRIGEIVSLAWNDAEIRAEVVDPVRYDPEGVRLRG